MTSDVLGFFDKSRESLAAARLLHDQGYAGFAASRAYYSMFYAAEALLSNLGLTYSKHSAVIAAFGREFARSSTAMQKMHRFLIDAESVRAVGDYRIDVAISIEDAAKVIGWADEFLTTTQKFLSENSGE